MADAQAMVDVDGEDASTAVKVFSSCLEMLELSLEQSVNNVASNAYSAGLIGEQMMDDVLDKTPMSRFERTLFLLRNIGKKMREPEEASVAMNHFLEILENEAAFRYLVKRIGEKNIFFTVFTVPAPAPKILALKCRHRRGGRTCVIIASYV